MVEPIFNIAACNGFEKAINTGLQLDPFTQAKLVDYEGVVVHLACLTPEAKCYIRIGSNCEVMHFYEDEPTVSIKGKLDEWLTLLTANDKASALINGQLSITGNSQLLIELKQITAQFDFDWEGQLASFIGDIPTHFIGNAVKDTAALGARINQTFIRTIDDFVHEEARLLPSKAETDAFYQALRQLEMRVERVDAQLQQLKYNTNSTSPNSIHPQENN